MTLEIRPGELLALLGPSGCGKTTTLRLIAGFDYPDTGAIRINGQDISHLPPNRRGLGMVFQNYSLFPHMSIAENIGFGLKMAGVGAKERAQAVTRMLEMIRLPDYGNRSIDQLSGGQQQRVALARALVTNPSVLLLDEPLGALDKNLREGMQFELKKLQRELGITSVMVTHDQEEAMTMSDRVVVMNQGSILQIGTPRDVYDRPSNRFVAEFLGTANVLSATVQEQRADSVRIDIAQLAHQGSCWVPLPQGGVQSGNAQVAIRPEKITLSPKPDDSIRFDGVVGECVFKGNQFSLLVDVPGLSQRIYVTLQASSGAGRIPEVGSRISMGLNPQDVTILATETSSGNEAV